MVWYTPNTLSQVHQGHRSTLKAHGASFDLKLTLILLPSKFIHKEEQTQYLPHNTYWQVVISYKNSIPDALCALKQITSHL